MPVVDTVVSCPVHKSFRVDQVAGMFDVALEEKAQAEFSVEVPGEDEDWSIGAIVGPSGSGKTTIARELFGDSIYSAARWAKSKAVIDGFGERGIKEITATLTAVGFSSPPSWVKPYRVLSNGEQFRCNLARAMLGKTPLVVFDEFTSVVDRNVAKIGSAAVAKAIRKGYLAKRFVAVTCHYDILEWLEPDWVVDMATCTLARGRLRRPEIRLQLYRCHHSAWKLFGRHHYLSGNLNTSAKCYLGVWEGTPVSFCATLPLVGRLKGCRRVTRIVVLPDYQGVGIGGATLDKVAEVTEQDNRRLRITTSHFAMRERCKRSPKWRATLIAKAGQTDGGGRTGMKQLNASKSLGRAVVSFAYCGRPADGPADGPADQESETSRVASA